MHVLELRIVQRLQFLGQKIDVHIRAALPLTPELNNKGDAQSTERFILWLQFKPVQSEPQLGQRVGA